MPIPQSWAKRMSSAGVWRDVWLISLVTRTLTNKWDCRLIWPSTVSDVQSDLDNAFSFSCSDELHRGLYIQILLMFCVYSLKVLSYWIRCRTVPYSAAPCCAVPCTVPDPVWNNRYPYVWVKISTVHYESEKQTLSFVCNFAKCCAIF